MFELPEYATIARQMNETIRGRRVASGTLGNSKHKFVWYNRKPDEFANIVRGKAVGETYVKGRWLSINLEPGYVLVFGECGGKILFHEDEIDIPGKYHLSLSFDDGSALTSYTQMWGAMELYEKGKELERQYIRGMRMPPTDEGFTESYLAGLVSECVKGGKRSVKSLLTQDQLIPGLGNSIAQDIMYVARLSPRREIGTLDAKQRKRLHGAIVKTVAKVTNAGGRRDEHDLFGSPGGYERIMDKNAADKPCPGCGTIVVKIQYLGGACYYCPACQV